MLDSHIHLDADQYADVAGLIKRARNAGVTAAVVPGITPASNLRVLELAQEFPSFVYPALGFHPEHFELTNDHLTETLALIREHRDRLCAIGEVGLPWYGEAARRDAVIVRSRDVLARFAELAAELDLPMILHSPHQTASDALRIIRAAGMRRAVFHWHKSDDTTTHAIVEAGYFISLTPEVTYRERDRHLAQLVPLDHLMMETDGPWPYQGRFAGRRTEPTFVADVLAEIAELRGEARAAVLEALARNAYALFGIAA